MPDYRQECYGESTMPFEALVAGTLVTQTNRYESAGSHECFLENSIGRFVILSSGLHTESRAKNLECAGARGDRSSCFLKESS
jgi:hypothetical protein